MHLSSNPRLGQGLPAPRQAAKPVERAATQPKNPLHGLTLEAIVAQLAAHYGWPGLAQRIAIRCFEVDPSVASSLKFLRKTPWARDKVEGLYLFMLREIRRARPKGDPAAEAPNGSGIPVATAAVVGD